MEVSQAQPPLMALAEQEQAEAEPSLDEQFAHILYLLMRDDISAATAIQDFEKTSVGIMQQYREASSALLHRAAHYLHTRRLASELEGQAASWQLLHTLYCSGETPAGSGIAGAADVGGQPTLTQITANAVNQRDDLRRTAQVVCWLESLAAQRLQEAHTSRFAHHEGLWRETLMTSGGSGFRGGPVVELDPDAPNRDKVKLAMGDRQGEERLAAQLWQLIRAGKLREARQLCCQAGAAWRCLSLGGGGEWGPLPVGPPAVEAAEEIDQQAAADELSWQVEGGLATSRIAWKWACYAAAEAAANATPGNRWEAAVYAALCGHVARMLPVCGTWEDELWAYCRAWLDLSTDTLLLNEVNEDQRASDYMLGARGEDMVSPELLLGCVSQAASSGYSSTADGNLLREGLAAVTGDWPKNGLLGDSERVTVPRNFTELAQLIANSSNSTVRSEARQQQHVLQLLTMSSDWLALTNELAQAALAAAEQLQQLQQGLGQQQDGQQQQQDDGDDAQMEDEGLPAEDEGVRAMSAESAAGVLRFAAHWALCLRALGLVQDHTWITDEQEKAETAKLQTVLGKVIYQYALQLAQQPATLRLVPAYLCHLRLGLRESLLEALLASATDMADDDDDCQALYLQLVAATEEWLVRQQRLNELVLQQGVQPGAWWDVDEEEAEDGNRRPSSCLFGDLRPQEVRLLLQQLVSHGFATAATSPLQRCRQLRWAFYSFTGAVAVQQQQLLMAAGAEAAETHLTLSSALPWQDTWGDALSYALALASEMALNPGFGSAGLQALLGQVVPASFLETVSRVAADQLAGDAGQQLQVQRQLLALAFWQRYVDLDARYQQWRGDWAAALSGEVKGNDGGALGAAGLLGEVAEQGQQLVAEMLHLALEDCLRLPAPVELVQLLQGDGEVAAAAAAGGGGSGSVVAEGEWLALPKFDAGEDKPTELLLALSVARGQAAGPGEVYGAAGDAADPDLPFVQLEEREAERLRHKISAFLAAATATTPDVTAEAAIIDDPNHDLAGTVAVRMTSFSDLAEPSGHEVDRARLQRRMTKAWQDMVDIAAHLLSSSSNSSGGAGSATAARDVPRLALVHMSASMSTRLALCRHRSTSKLLRRSGKVLLDLARSGHPTSQLDVLIHAAGDAGGRDGPQLLGLLSPADAGKLLVCLEQIIEEGGLLDEDEDLLLQD